MSSHCITNNVPLKSLPPQKDISFQNARKSISYFQNCIFEKQFFYGQTALVQKYLIHWGNFSFDFKWNQIKIKWASFDFSWLHLKLNDLLVRVNDSIWNQMKISLSNQRTKIKKIEINILPGAWKLK